MKNVANKTKKAINEKHLLALLEENQMLLQAVKKLHQDVFETDQAVKFIGKGSTQPNLHLIQDDIPSLLDNIIHVEMMLKGCYKTPSTSGVTSISKLHFKCIEDLQNIKVRLSSN